VGQERYVCYESLCNKESLQLLEVRGADSARFSVVALGKCFCIQDK
jgi:hypothetical protein